MQSDWLIAIGFIGIVIWSILLGYILRSFGRSLEKEARFKSPENNFKEPQ